MPPLSLGARTTGCFVFTPFSRRGEGGSRGRAGEPAARTPPIGVEPPRGHKVSYEAIVVLAAHELLPFKNLAPSFCRDPGSPTPEPVSATPSSRCWRSSTRPRRGTILPLICGGRSLYCGRLLQILLDSLPWQC